MLVRQPNELGIALAADNVVHIVSAKYRWGAQEPTQIADAGDFADGLHVRILPVIEMGRTVYLGVNEARQAVSEALA
jgi:hypothetical protein